MNSLTRLSASISALIASISFAWIALTITGTIPHRQATVYHNGSFVLEPGPLGFEITHEGSIEITH